MDCIPYINDLKIEIDVLKQINNGSDEIESKIKQKERQLEIIKDNLSKLSNNSIEYRLYLKILNGVKPTKAIEELAEENYQNGVKPTDVPYIFTKYYKNLKKILKNKVKTK